MTNSNQNTPPVGSSLNNISEYIKEAATERRGRSIPPLDKWNPEHHGEMDLVIKANGEWWHEGGRVTRQSLVDLFATVLWAEGSGDDIQYYLKTPVEKISITVEDVPFFITEVNVVEKDTGPVLEFLTSTGDVVDLDDEHPLQMGVYNGEERPYIEVRFGMKGLISRNVLMHLINLGQLTEKDGQTLLTLNSGGKAYALSVAN